MAGQSAGVASLISTMRSLPAGGDRPRADSRAGSRSPPTSVSVDERQERRRITGRGVADQPRPAAVRRRGGDQAGPGRLPGRGARPDPPGAGGPAAVGDPGPPRPGSVHAEERPEVHPVVGAHGAALGRDLEARRVLRAVQRPPHAALVRQPARRRVPPDAGAGRPSRPRDPSGARPRPARRRRLLDGRAGRPARPPGAGRCRAGRCGQDQRRQGRARVRPDRRPGAAGGLGRRDPRHRGAGRAPRSRDRHDRVHEGGPRRQGVRRLDAGRRGHGDRRLQPARPPRRAGVVPGGLGRPRRRRAGRLHRAHGAATARRPRPVGRADARSAAVERRPHRGGPRDPGRSGAGDARGQAPRPRAAASGPEEAT